MAEDDKPLSEVSATEYLTAAAQRIVKSYRTETGDQGFAVSPEEGSSLPKFFFDASLDPSGAPTVRASAGSNFPGGNFPGGNFPGGRLLAARELSRPVDSSGPVTKDTFEAGYGPLSGFYSTESQSGSNAPQSTTYGGKLAAGPFELFGERSRLRQAVVDPRHASEFLNPRVDATTNTVGVSGRGPLFGGTAEGSLSRQSSGIKLPQHVSQSSRPTAPPTDVDSFFAKWTGRAGPGILSLDGGLKGQNKQAGISYDVRDLFGLGGTARAEARYDSPEGGESSAGVGFRYRVPL